MILLQTQLQFFFSIELCPIIFTSCTYLFTYGKITARKSGKLLRLQGVKLDDSKNISFTILKVDCKT